MMINQFENRRTAGTGNTAIEMLKSDAELLDPIICPGIEVRCSLNLQCQTTGLNLKLKFIGTMSNEELWKFKMMKEIIKNRKWNSRLYCLTISRLESPSEVKAKSWWWWIFLWEKVQYIQQRWQLLERSCFFLLCIVLLCY